MKNNNYIPFYIDLTKNKVLAEELETSIASLNTAYVDQWYEKEFKKLEKSYKKKYKKALYLASDQKKASLFFKQKESKENKEKREHFKNMFIYREMFQKIVIETHKFYQKVEFSNRVSQILENHPENQLNNTKKDISSFKNQLDQYKTKNEEIYEQYSSLGKDIFNNYLEGRSKINEEDIKIIHGALFKKKKVEIDLTHYPPSEEMDDLLNIVVKTVNYPEFPVIPMGVIDKNNFKNIEKDSTKILAISSNKIILDLDKELKKNYKNEYYEKEPIKGVFKKVTGFLNKKTPNAEELNFKNIYLQENKITELNKAKKQHEEAVELNEEINLKLLTIILEKYDQALTDKNNRLDNVDDLKVAIKNAKEYETILTNKTKHHKNIIDNLEKEIGNTKILLDQNKLSEEDRNIIQKKLMKNPKKLVHMEVQNIEENSQRIRSLSKNSDNSNDAKSNDSVDLLFYPTDKENDSYESDLNNDNSSENELDSLKNTSVSMFSLMNKAQNVSSIQNDIDNKLKKLIEKREGHINFQNKTKEIIKRFMDEHSEEKGCTDERKEELFEKHMQGYISKANEMLEKSESCTNDLNVKIKKLQEQNQNKTTVSGIHKTSLTRSRSMSRM